MLTNTKERYASYFVHMIVTKACKACMVHSYACDGPAQPKASLMASHELDADDSQSKKVTFLRSVIACKLNDFASLRYAHHFCNLYKYCADCTMHALSACL